MALDEYEKEILEADRKGQLKRKRPSKKKMSEYQIAARETLAKDKRVNIRLSTKDLRDIQLKALEEGIPYQTLMASILHKFLTGTLVPAYNNSVAQTAKRGRSR